jgi:hypothetical protein
VGHPSDFLSRGYISAVPAGLGLEKVGFATGAESIWGRNEKETADLSTTLRSVEKHFHERSAELQIPRLPRFPVESCGFGQLHVVLFRENHISGAAESCEVGNPGTRDDKGKGNGSIKSSC